MTKTQETTSLSPHFKQPEADAAVIRCYVIILRALKKQFDSLESQTDLDSIDFKGTQDAIQQECQDFLATQDSKVLAELVVLPIIQEAFPIARKHAVFAVRMHSSADAGFAALSARLSEKLDEQVVL